MVSETGGGSSDDGSDLSGVSEFSDTDFDCLVDDILTKLSICQPLSKANMTIKNRKDRTKSEHPCDRDGTDASSGNVRHLHPYKPYVYADDRKEGGFRARSRVSHQLESSLGKVAGEPPFSMIRCSDNPVYQTSAFARGHSRLPAVQQSDCLGNAFECRVGIRDSVSNHKPPATIDRDNENNSEDEYQISNQNFRDVSLQADETNLEKLLMEKKGWKVVKVKADGACLFRSVSHQIFGDEENHDVVRKQVIDYMLKNKEHFSPYVTEEFNHYIDRKRDAACYGNHIEIQAIAELYNRPVEIYHDSVDPINVFHAEYSKEFPIRLSYHLSVHYNSVVDPFKPSFGHGLGMPNYQPSLTESDLIAQALHESEATQLEETMLRDKLSETEQLEIDRCMEAEAVRQSYFDYLNQLQLPKRRNLGSPSNQLSMGSLSTVVHTPQPVTTSVDVASSSTTALYTTLRLNCASPPSVAPIPSSSQNQQFPSDFAGMNEDAILAMVLEQSRIEYLESLRKRRISSAHESGDPFSTSPACPETVVHGESNNSRSTSPVATAYPTMDRQSDGSLNAI